MFILNGSNELEILLLCLISILCSDPFYVVQLINQPVKVVDTFLLFIYHIQWRQQCYATLYFNGQRSWVFLIKTTTISLQFLKNKCLFSFDGPADLSRNFVAVGSFMNSQRRFFELESSSFANLRLELASSKTSRLSTIFIIVWRRSTRTLSRNGSWKDTFKKFESSSNILKKS